jgi:two-component system, OmpR family, alkaline phosphatase synthesis response regulator PhoP
MSKQQILVVDDDEDILGFVSYNLSAAGYQAITASNGQDALALAQKLKPELILLDLMMPGMDGIEICTELRSSKGHYQPLIVFLTARAEDYSQVAALESGADDYIVKPIRPRLLITKIESILRRRSVGFSEEMEMDTGKFILDRGSHQIIQNGEAIELPRKEFDLLSLLISRPGYVFTREQIMDTVWGNETVVGDRTIDVHIRKIREKIGDDCIKTVKGVGYKFVA